MDRVGYWKKNGAQASDTVAALLKTFEKQQKVEQPAGAAK